MTKKESTYTIKIFGSKQDVQEATVAIEKIIGIDGIKRMTGIKPSSDSGQHFRFIEAHSGSSAMCKAIPVITGQELPAQEKSIFSRLISKRFLINKNDLHKEE